MSKTILILDDDPVVTLIIKKMVYIIDSNTKCFSFKNGELGLDFLKEFSFSSGNLIVLIDINMPVLDGWGFLDELQKTNFKHFNKTKFCIVSSSTDVDDQQKCKDYPMIHKFYHKPLYKQDLIEILN